MQTSPVSTRLCLALTPSFATAYRNLASAGAVQLVPYVARNARSEAATKGSETGWPSRISECRTLESSAPLSRCILQLAAVPRGAEKGSFQWLE